MNGFHPSICTLHQKKQDITPQTTRDHYRSFKKKLVVFQLPKPPKKKHHHAPLVGGFNPTHLKNRIVKLDDFFPHHHLAHLAHPPTPPGPFVDTFSLCNPKAAWAAKGSSFRWSWALSGPTVLRGWEIWNDIKSPKTPKIKSWNLKIMVWKMMFRTSRSVFSGSMLIFWGVSPSKKAHKKMWRWWIVHYFH